jgi:hypothetical protein
VSSFRIRAIIRVYAGISFLRAASKLFAKAALKRLFWNKPERELRTAELKKMPHCYRSAHAAVGSPVHLGHLAGDDVRLETPATNPAPRAFSQDHVMTRR